jgi:D-alanine-D-alanine ligase
MPSTRVLIAYNEPVLPLDHPDRPAEDDVLYSVKVICDSLNALGYEHTKYGVTDDIPALLQRLQTHDYDLVFNLYEGNADRSVTEVYFTGLLEWMNIPYTGCTAFTLNVARHKPTAKAMFQASGVKTPKFVLAESADIKKPPFKFPMIVKPASEDASIGIEQSSVVKNMRALRKKIADVIANYGSPVLVEQFIVGRELQISLIEKVGADEPSVLPFSEIEYHAGSELWPVYTFTAKWDENSAEYKAAPVKVNVKVSEELQAKVTEACLRAYRVMQARDFARIDTRVTPEGDVYVLELNPNPSITSVMIDQGLPAINRTYDQFIGDLVEAAVKRSADPAGERRTRGAHAT